MNQAHRITGFLFDSVPCAGHSCAIVPGPTPSLTSEESGHAETRVSAAIAPALLREAACVDTQETKRLCCAAAGIISTSSATAGFQPPHDRLRQATPADAILIASDRPPAQPFKGYAHLPFYAPTSEEKTVCDCIANAIHSTLAANAADAFSTVEQMSLEIYDTLLRAGALNPEFSRTA